MKNVIYNHLTINMLHFFFKGVDIGANYLSVLKYKRKMNCTINSAFTHLVILPLKEGLNLSHSYSNPSVTADLPHSKMLSGLNCKQKRSANPD